GNANMWSHSGILNETIYQNNITVDGAGQTWQEPDNRWPDEAGKILKQENTADYSYFGGRNTQAYVQGRSRVGTPLLKDSVRKVIYLAPDAFIVCDRVQPLKPGAEIQWHLHSKNTITIRNTHYSFDNGQYALQGQLVSPTSGASIRSTPVM